MTDLRKAAQQALEALGSSLYPQPRQMAAIAALRAALADQVTFGIGVMKGGERIDPASIYSDIVSDGGMDPRNKFDVRPTYKHFTKPGCLNCEESVCETCDTRRTLTDEQISVLWHESGHQPFKFARMIEGTLK